MYRKSFGGQAKRNYKIELDADTQNWLTLRLAE